jgi:hypothetical protein
MKFPDALPAATAETFAMIHTNARTDADHVEVTEERLRQICIDAGLDTTAASGESSRCPRPPSREYWSRLIRTSLRYGMFVAHRSNGVLRMQILCSRRQTRT